MWTWLCWITTNSCNESKKHEVVRFDISKIKLKNTLKEVITDELDLNELDLHATTDSDELKDTDIFIICVPTCS